MARDELKHLSFGFSLLEMIVVLALMASLFGIFIFRTKGFQDQTKIERVRGDLRSLQKAIQAYYLNHQNQFPAGSDWQNNDLTNDAPRLLRQILYDPFESGNTEYRYFVSPNGKYYVVFSVGSNDVADITGITDTGKLLGVNADDIFVSNGADSF